MSHTKFIIKSTPLCFVPDGRLVCYRRGKILVFDNEQLVKDFYVFKNLRECVLGRSRILTRLMRLGLRAACSIDNDIILISCANKIYELNIENESISDGFSLDEGIRPLAFSQVNGVEGFRDGIYFGGYLHNPDKNPVSIYRRTGKDEWETVFIFPQGSINHVHNIIPDRRRKCLWVFTGDFDKAAAIWKAQDDFRSIEYFVGGNQKWRGSVAFVLGDDLLYATDTPRADNYLYRLNPDTKALQAIMPLHGSCIYGCKWKDNYVLASTVESEGGDTSFMEYWFGRKRGKGIKDEYVHLYYGNMEKGFKEIYKEKKDWLPYTLFQFGVFKFPSGQNDTDFLYLQPIATNVNDQKLMCIDAKSICV